MEILYIAHCVPWPPDKGNKIRAFHSVSLLAGHHRVHLACLAQDVREASAESVLKDRLASVRIEKLDVARAFARGVLGLIRGGSFTTSFHAGPPLAEHIRTVLETRPIKAVVVLSSSMAAFVPSGVPFLADWGDVDSEKRFQYAQLRFPGILQRLEARRMRRDECEGARRARRTFLTTQNELQLFSGIAPDARCAVSGNGVDAEYFDSRLPLHVPAGLTRRNYLVFVGMLNYFPNVDGISRFAETVFPKLRRSDPSLELLLVGRKPAARVIGLDREPGITVVGGVEDVRPYLWAARAAVAPLRIARGIQNKVLEALAMGKRVLASEEVCRTFAPDLPAGIHLCRSADEYVRTLGSLPRSYLSDPSIAEDARKRFSWPDSLAPIVSALAEIEAETLRSTHRAQDQLSSSYAAGDIAANGTRAMDENQEEPLAHG